MADLEKEKKDLMQELENCKKRLAELEKEMDAREPEETPARREEDGFILIVEDEEQVRDLIQRVLETSGYNVLVAESADQALEMSREYSDRLRLVLTDIMMPGKSGAELARQLKVSRPELKILFMSGYAEGPIVPDDVYDVIDQRSKIIEKPFSSVELLDLIRNELDN